MGTCKQQSWITVKVVQPPSSIGDWAVQVRAGESRAEEQGFVLTNTVYKTSMESGLSKRGQNQVRAPPCAQSPIRRMPLAKSDSDHEPTGRSAVGLWESQDAVCELHSVSLYQSAWPHTL